MQPSSESAELEPGIDRLLHAWQGRLTGGIDPIALSLAYLDWSVHLANAPGKQAQLAAKAWRKYLRWQAYALQAQIDPHTPPCIEPLPQDQRFSDPRWQQWPFNLIYQAFLLTQQWWHNTATDVPGVTPHHEAVVAFAARQWLDTAAPANFLATNPELLEATVAESGMNLVRGAMNALEDWQHALSGAQPIDGEQFTPGKQVAVTPGAVIYRNTLIELIQYSPTTPSVYAEPILFVPAWIMKYYILDLSPQNSLVRYLVDHGHTVFMISWKNPGPEDRNLSLDDYRTLGVMAALDVIGAISPQRAVHAVGYCLGGTLLTIAAAAMARDGDQRLHSVTLFAAQTDFTEAGELSLFTAESQVAYLNDLMWSQGFLDTAQLSGAFQLLRSNDLIWSRITHEYLLGRRRPLTDLMAWNADGTRLPYRMHAEYLERLFLRNELFTGRYYVGDRPIALSDIAAPMFVVTTVKDHVAPWRSVYKLHLLEDTEVTFVLAGGGHNAGIVSEPGHPHRSYQIATRTITDKYIDPETWQAATPVQQGSWWPEWQAWLVALSNAQTKPPGMGAPAHGYPPLEAAPGTYVFQR